MLFPLKDDNPTTITPYVTVALIAANVLVFFYQLSLGERLDQFIYQYGAIPAVILGSQTLPADMVAIPATLSLFTSMFMHGGFMHIIGNMLYLWIFGNNIEDAMGHVKFILFYFITGLAASMAHLLSDVSSTIPTVGASGAISGVLGAYLLLYPRAQVMTFLMLFYFIRLMYIPAGLVLGFWFLLQIVNSVISGAGGGGVAWWAHIGGFVAGMALVGIFKKQDVKFFNPPHYHENRYVKP
jgi:membrane associated rhomboid family serine protease